MDQNDMKRSDGDVATKGTYIFWELNLLINYLYSLSENRQIGLKIQIFLHFYFPILAIVALPVNIVTLVILTRGNCGISRCVNRYLVAKIAADLLVIILDLILRHIPVLYKEQFLFLKSIRVCNIHAVLLHAVTNCSVWFTVAFTFDRFVAICCLSLKSKYCTEKRARVVLGTVTALSFASNIFWYFYLTDKYWVQNFPTFCATTLTNLFSPVWAAIEFAHYMLTPGLPCVIIVLLNACTVRHILLTSRVRANLRGHRNGASERDPELESRRKCMILLFLISRNFILLWSPYMWYFIRQRMANLGLAFIPMPSYVQGIAFILQLLSCCTNTCIYAATQPKFREQLKNALKYPFTPVVNLIMRSAKLMNFQKQN